jgi:integrase/recombinase XerD
VDAGAHAFCDATILGREKALRPLLRWCAERTVSRANEVTRPILERYQRHLFHYRRRTACR